MEEHRAIGVRPGWVADRGRENTKRPAANQLLPATANYSQKIRSFGVPQIHLDLFCLIFGYPAIEGPSVPGNKIDT
jgi:hypothetical protein